MRPLELTIQGFKSYRRKCSFSFEGRSLFGIVGPTGAGKSSILDALIYCLYGKTPRLERETKKLINSEEDEAKLQLCFEMDGVAWEVTRVVRRKGQSQVVLRRLDEGVEPVTGDRNVNERLPHILGLDFGAFCASVCLSQGEFDRFLSATASERVQILKGVFALDKVDALREAAKGHARFINDQTRVLQGNLEALPKDLEASIEQTRTRWSEALKVVSEIQEVMPAVNDAQMELDRFADEEQSIQAERRQTEKALRSLPPDEVIQDLVGREDSTRRVLADAEKALSTAEAGVAAVHDELAEIEKKGRGWDWCLQVEAAIRLEVQVRAEHQAQIALVERTDDELRKAQRSLTGADETHASAKSAFIRAGAELAEIQQRHAAHLLRSHLIEGKPCPVCEQVVSEVPGTPSLPAIDDAKAAYDAAESRLAEARETLESARRAVALAGERRQNAVDKSAALFEKLTENVRLLAALVGEGNDAQPELSFARQVLEGIKTRSKSALLQRQEAAQTLKDASVARKGIQEEMMAMITALSSVCGRLGLDADGIRQEGLPQTAKRARELATMRLEKLDMRILQLTATAEAARSAVKTFRARFAAGAEEAPAQVLARAMSRAQSFEERKGELEAALRRRYQIEDEMRQLMERKGLYERLSTDLTDSRFTAYLLSEQTRLLCELASEKFHELTGYYTFDFDAQGNITVVDERTGSVRSPQDTLSGGESFLGSLSLALALAETVGNQGGRLECFFLDEGFGSLDAEALDRALEGIQTLAEPGRMIALISHVGGIQSQLEDLIVLERNSDGSTSIVQEGGPIAYLPAAI